MSLMVYKVQFRLICFSLEVNNYCFVYLGFSPSSQNKTPPPFFVYYSFSHSSDVVRK